MRFSIRYICRAYTIHSGWKITSKVSFLDFSENSLFLAPSLINVQFLATLFDREHIDQKMRLFR